MFEINNGGGETRNSEKQQISGIGWGLSASSMEEKKNISLGVSRAMKKNR